MTCPDSAAYDWATATLYDNTKSSLTWAMPNICEVSAAWKKVTIGITSGHSYTLTLISHDDNTYKDPSYTLFDQIQLIYLDPVVWVQGRTVSESCDQACSSIGSVCSANRVTSQTVTLPIFQTLVSQTYDLSTCSVTSVFSLSSCSV